MTTQENEINGKTPYKVAINMDWCKKCGICTAYCPKGVFVEDDFASPIIEKPENCIKCMLCVIRCPDFCIEVTDAEEEAAKKKQMSK